MSFVSVDLFVLVVFIRVIVCFVGMLREKFGRIVFLLLYLNVILLKWMCLCDFQRLIGFLGFGIVGIFFSILDIFFSVVVVDWQEFRNIVIFCIGVKKLCMYSMVDSSMLMVSVFLEMWMLFQSMMMLSMSVVMFIRLGLNVLNSSIEWWFMLWYFFVMFWKVLLLWGFLWNVLMVWMLVIVFMNCMMILVLMMWDLWYMSCDWEQNYCIRKKSGILLIVRISFDCQFQKQSVMNVNRLNSILEMSLFRLLLRSFLMELRLLVWCEMMWLDVYDLWNFRFRCWVCRKMCLCRLSSIVWVSLVVMMMYYVIRVVVSVLVSRQMFLIMNVGIQLVCLSIVGSVWLRLMLIRIGLVICSVVEMMRMMVVSMICGFSGLIRDLSRWRD